MQAYGISKNDNDMNPTGALARLLSFKSKWKPSNPLRQMLYDMEVADPKAPLYCSATIEIARKYLNHDFSSADRIEEFADSKIFELIHVCILPFEWANSFNCGQSDPAVSIAFQMANGFPIDMDDSRYSNVTPREFGIIGRLVEYLRDESIIGWTDKTESIAKDYQQIRLPVFLVQGNKMAPASYQDAINTLRESTTQQIGSGVDA